jgi:hypothetical protein
LRRVELRVLVYTVLAIQFAHLLLFEHRRRLVNQFRRRLCQLFRALCARYAFLVESNTIHNHAAL